VRFYIIRHAQREPSEDFAASEAGDPEAEITPEGKLTATAVGEWMADKEELPTVIYASPAVRTQQTAGLIADAIEDAGFVKPEVETDVGIGPNMSIRALIQKLIADRSNVRVAIVSHHESIMAGLNALSIDNDGVKREIDAYASGEVRVLKVKRKNGDWEEHTRVRPSDMGFGDYY
jgi:phosphohistidine phosphatase